MAIEIYAGKRAYHKIKEEGLNADQISLIVGASGGPKWLVLSKLDQYLNDQFLASASQPIELIGSSIGAWRMSCYAQKDPSAAIKRLTEAYSTVEYQDKPSRKEVSDSAAAILKHTLGVEGASDSHHAYIVNNPHRSLHVVTVRNRSLFNHESFWVQGLSLGLAALSNPVSSKAVEGLFPRVVFSQKPGSWPYRNLRLGEQVQLDEENLSASLMASGAIPFVLEPVRVSGSKERLHWDGGLVDYHFEGPFKSSDDLVLYPHFYPKLIPGWLDKGLPWRRVNPEQYDNVVVLCPSKAFIDSLPDQHVPDRNDLKRYDTQTRIDNWQKVIADSEVLVEAFHDALSKDQARSLVRPLSEMSY